MDQNGSRTRGRQGHFGYISQTKMFYHFRQNNRLPFSSKGLHLVQLPTHIRGIQIPSFLVPGNLRIDFRHHSRNPGQQPGLFKISRKQYGHTVYEGVFEVLILQEAAKQQRRCRTIGPIGAIFSCCKIKYVILEFAVLVTEPKVHIVDKPFPFGLWICPTPFLQVVRRPVPIVHEQFRMYVIHKIVHIHLGRHFGIILVIV